MAAKSCCLDPIPAPLLKLCIAELLPVITKIVNLSLECAEMPKPMKEAVLSPLLKKPSLDYELYSSFRPISNLMFLSKAAEKVAAERLWDYLCSNGLNEELQSAYKEHHSCETALIRVQNDILKAIDSRRCVFLLLLDLSAAFDTVDHGILLNRLCSRFGIRGKVLAWLQSYLTDRTQFVQIDGAASTVRSLRCGVPQSTVLGPMLYLLYTSPLGDIIRMHGLLFHLYADDTQLYTTFVCNDDQDLAAVKYRVESCVADINKWMTYNKLKLNNGKLELLLLHSRFRPPLTFPSLTVGIDIIHPVDYVRNLGVIFDSTLSMSRQVNSVVKGAYYHIRNISKIRKYISYSTAEILVHSFVSSKLDYCNSLLCGLPQQEIAKLQSVQNAAARVISCLGKYDHITDTLRELHWLPIKQRIVFKVNLLTFKSLNNLAPNYLTDLLEFYRPSRNLRSSNDHFRLKQPAFNMKTYGQRAFTVVAPRLWNELPLDVRASPNLNTFKIKLKTYLFKCAYYS